MSIARDVTDCEACSLRAGCTQPLHGTHPNPSNLKAMIVGDAPGIAENYRCNILAGRAGGAWVEYLRLAGLPSAHCHITNVIKCPVPEKKRTREVCDDNARVCGDIHLTRELDYYRPDLIIAAGSVSARYILPDFTTMEAEHGIARYAKVRGRKVVVIPINHPAAGISSQPMIQPIREDFRAIGKFLRTGKAVKINRRDKWKGEEEYEVVRGRDVRSRLAGAGFVAVDTEAELGADGRWIPWSVQFSTRSGSGCLVYPDDAVGLSVIAEYLAKTDVTTIIHNAAFDLPVLRDMGIVPANTHDSLIAARIIQTIPRGLKPLAFRFAGMNMGSYNDVTGPYMEGKGREYLELVLSRDFPDPDPIEVWEMDKEIGDYLPRIKQPSHIHKRVERILFDTIWADADPFARWNSIPWEEGRGMVEAEIGPMPRAWLSDVPESDALYYACRDADATLRVYPKIMKLLKKFGLMETFETDMKAQNLVTEMERCGMPVRRKALRKLDKRYTSEKEVLGRKINVEARHYVNPASWLHVSRLVYEELRLPRPAKKKDYNSTNARYLRPHAPNHPLIAHILDWRECKKMTSAFVQPLIDMAERSHDHRVHASLQVTGTLTGRMTSNNPNLLAMPTRTAKGTEVRNAFHARKGCAVVHADYGKMDFCIMAHASRDPEMMRIFREGLDIHEMTAEKIFGIPPAEQDKYLHRLPAKTVGFGVAFGLTAAGLKDIILAQGGDESFWTNEKCEELITEWFKVYKGVRAFFDETIKFAARHSYVKDPFGRIRWVAGVHSQDEYVREEACRQACNAVIQGGTAGVIKRAMVNIQPVIARIRSEGRVCDPLLQIHDALIFEIDKKIAVPFAKELATLMEDAVELRVPITAQADIGESWGSMQEFKGGDEEEWNVKLGINEILEEEE